MYWTKDHITAAAEEAGVSPSDAERLKAQLAAYYSTRNYTEPQIRIGWREAFEHCEDERLAQLMTALMAGPEVPSYTTYERMADAPLEVQNQIPPAIRALIDEGRYAITDHTDGWVVVHTARAFHHLTHDEYLVQLRKHREYIASGAELQFFDDNTMGVKDTSASWGLCSDALAPEFWNDVRLQIFPLDFVRDGRMASREKDETNGDMCPFDARAKFDGNGCFFKCRIFNPPHIHPRLTRAERKTASEERKREQSKREPVPTREEALRLYDETIARASARSATIPPAAARGAVGFRAR